MVKSVEMDFSRHCRIKTRGKRATNERPSRHTNEYIQQSKERCAYPSECGDECAETKRRDVPAQRSLTTPRGISASVHGNDNNAPRAVLSMLLQQQRGIIVIACIGSSVAVALVIVIKIRRRLRRGKEETNTTSDSK